MKCDYCQSVCADGARKCESCGAPLQGDAVTDYRFCPHCKRRLLALGSPACNYCGHALPESYVKAREAMRTRIAEADARHLNPEEIDGLEADDALRRALKSLFDLNRKSK